MFFFSILGMIRHLNYEQANKMFRYFSIILLQAFFLTNIIGQAPIDSLLRDTSLVESVAREAPEAIILENIDNISFKGNNGKLHLFSENSDGQISVDINGSEKEIEFVNGLSSQSFGTDQKGSLQFISYPGPEATKYRLFHISANKDNSFRVKPIPLWLSIVPPLLAILLALIFKEVIISLMMGIWSGAFIAGGLRIDSLYWFLDSIMKTVQKYVVNALDDSGHISVIVFSLLIGGMVAIVSKNGGMGGVVLSLSKYARTPRSTQFIAWLLGLAIFFDDYANTLIVGNTMRKVTDKFRISREKLAYIVDSTSAPVAAVFFITTWIGAELGYIDDGLSKIDLGFDITPYSVFLQSLKYSFYPFLTLAFILILIKTGKDYGPMFKAEHRARTTGQVSPALNKEQDEPDMEDLTPVKNAPLKWFNAVIPIGIVILMTIYGLVSTGMESLYGQLTDLNIISVENSWSSVWSHMGLLLSEGQSGFLSKLGTLVGSSDSYVALLWASLSGVFAAVLLTVSQKIMSLWDTMHWLVEGIKTMIPAIVILTLAWSLAITTQELHTADFLSNALQYSVNPYVLPMIIFVLSAFIAFSTGSSWSTMAILYPIAIPTTYAICQANGMDMDITFELMLNVISTVLAASVLGDHCSPISDTTILSSLASDCNHLDHVKTQMPYALTVGCVSLIMVGLSTLLGGGWMISFILLLIGIAALYLVVRFWGRVAQ